MQRSSAVPIETRSCTARRPDHHVRPGVPLRSVSPVPRSSAALVSMGNDWQHWAKRPRHTPICPRIHDAQPPLSAQATTGNTGQSGRGILRGVPLRVRTSCVSNRPIRPDVPLRSVTLDQQCSAALVSMGNDWQHWAQQPRRTCPRSPQCSAALVSMAKTGNTGQSRLGIRRGVPLRVRTEGISIIILTLPMETCSVRRFSTAPV